MSQEIQNPQFDEELAEKCRIALEKHYGFKIPLPKIIQKTANKKISTKPC